MNGYQGGGGIASIPAAARLTGGVLSEWVTPDDLLVILVRNALVGVNLAFNARVWHPDDGVKEWNDVLIPTSDRTLNTFSFPLQYGYLTSAAIQATAGSPTRGATLATMLVARPPATGFATKMILAQDYVTSQYGPLWPGGRQSLGVEGPGRLFTVSVTTPGAGADWSQTVPTNARWLLHSARGTFTTSATVANRQPFLQGLTPLVSYESPTTLTQAASLTFTWLWAPGIPTIGQIDQTVRQVQALFFPGYFAGGQVIQTTTFNIQAADQWSVVRLLVEEWLED